MDDIDDLVGPATPHFAYQIRARVKALVDGLPEGPPGAALRRGEDGAPRPARPRVVEGRGGPARARDAARLGGPPEPRPRLRRRPTARERSTGKSVLVTGGSRGIGRGDRAPLRRARRRPGRDQLPAKRPGRRGDGARRSAALGAEPLAPARQPRRSRADVRAFVEEAGAARRARLERGHRRHPPGARADGEALGLDDERERPRAPHARAARRARRCRRAARSSRSRASARPRARRLRRSSARRRRPSSRSSATSPSSSRRATSASTRLGRPRRDGRPRALPEARDDARQFTRGERRPAGSSSRTTSPTRWRSSPRRTPR